jgi:hypothetical protein
LFHSSFSLKVPFNTMEGRRKPKVADWLMFLRSAIPYTFYQVGPMRPREAFQDMIQALQHLLDATADYDPEAVVDETANTCRTARTMVARALFKLERDLPATELSIAIHELIHVPDFLWRWNSVRNYWCFVVERLVGFMKKFVKNRYLAVENLVLPPNILMHTLGYSISETHLYDFRPCVHKKHPCPTTSL